MGAQQVSVQKKSDGDISICEHRQRFSPTVGKVGGWGRGNQVESSSQVLNQSKDLCSWKSSELKDESGGCLNANEAWEPGHSLRSH